MPTKSPKKTLGFINKVMDKKALNGLFSQIYLDYGTSKTAFLADQLKNLGFRYATKAGTTISIDDLTVPQSKKDLLKQAEDEIERATYRYLKGEITEVERYTKVIDTWSETTEKLTQSVVECFSRTNPVYMMAFSGARGNLSQVSQLVGMRGLMADAQGQIIDLPIKSNFKEGLSVTEYIISSYGARKGLVDTALKTADSGYLTRRLVDVAQDVIIRTEDCDTGKFIEIEAIRDADKEYVSLPDRLLGRTIYDDVVDPDGKVILTKNTTLNNDDIKKIAHLGLKKIKIRSPLTCECEYGICQKCYGWALTKNNPVDVGEAIGIIAAQSIGEPGTQLTMRTFHTGGVFRGSSSMREIISPVDGTIVSKIATKDLRTRHGDDVQVSIRENKMEIEDAKGKKHSVIIPYGSTINHISGETVKKGDILALYEPGTAADGSGRLTERATKDITTDIGGKIFFDSFSVDEKRDRQGNISRTANRSGKIWVLAGDVYNLPGGSEILVEDNQLVKQGEVLAETTTVSEHGGEVRLSGELEVEEITKGGKKIKKIVNGKEITIVIASITPENAVLEQTKKEQIWKVNGGNESYIVKSPIDTLVENGMVIAELIEEEATVQSSGEIRYAGVETDENQIVTTPGKVVFIPEEIHQVNKDSSLKLVESGTYAVAGTEVVKDVRTHIDGVIEIKEYNDIIHEVIVRPGELIKLDDVNKLKAEDGEIVEAGFEVAPGIFAKEKSMVSIISGMGAEIAVIEDITDEDVDTDITEEIEPVSKAVEVLIRPVQEYDITPKDVSIKFNTTDELIEIVPVTQLQYRDGARIRQLDGANLTRVSLVLQMSGYLSHLKGLVELISTGKKKENSEGEIVDDSQLKIVVLESIIVRRETEAISREKASLQTELLVESGQVIDAKTPVAKTQVLARNDAKVSLSSAEKAEMRRLLLISPDAKESIAVKSKPIVKAGELISLDQVITDSGEKAQIAGKVLEVGKNEIVIHKARPYLISAGAMLQVSNDALVQRGDFLATLVFERQKTGDIVQGLPRVEELLEGRKPKDSALLAEEDGEAVIEYDEDAIRLFLVSETGRHEIKVPIDSNIIVSDKQKIKQGQPLTSGPLNPHDVVRLSGVEAVQQYLLDEVQRVYRSQGVEIADKHVEVIVRQMSKKVKVDESGDTKLLPGELTESYTVEQENKAVKELNGELATFHPVLLGITKASLNTESFISAASFQETTRVLTEAAVEGKKDMLRGLKENVIIGRLIPAGTGYHHLTHSSEDLEEEERKRRSRNNARKPSAILEEIEGLFGSPDFSIEEAMGAVMAEDVEALEGVVEGDAESLDDSSIIEDEE
jgi:DNA-directed RNA polymerase subunit beta'